MRNIRENVFLAFVYNALGVPIGRRLSLSSVSVVGNVAESSPLLPFSRLREGQVIRA